MMIFDYTIKVKCDKEDIDDVVKFFKDNNYGEGRFDYNETNYGFIGYGECYRSFVMWLGYYVCELSKRHNNRAAKTKHSLRCDFKRNTGV